MRRITTASARPGRRPPTSSTCSRTRWWRWTGTARRRSPISPNRGPSAPDGKLYTFKLRDDVQLLQRQEVHRRRRGLFLQAPDQPRAQGAAGLARRQPQGDARARSLHRRIRAERAVRRPAAQPHHVHHRDPQPGERGGAGQGLRHQGDRRHRAVVLRELAAAHRDRAEAPRRLQMGPVDVPEQGAGEVRETLDQDRAGGFQPPRRDDGRPVRRHPPDPAAVHPAGQGRAEARRPGGQAELPADVLRLQDHAADGVRQARARGDEHRHQPRRHRQGHHAGQRRARLHLHRLQGARLRRHRPRASSRRTSSARRSCSTRPAGRSAPTASARRTASSWRRACCSPRSPSSRASPRRSRATCARSASTGRSSATTPRSRRPRWPSRTTSCGR